MFRIFVARLSISKYFTKHKSKTILTVIKPNKGDINWDMREREREHVVVLVFGNVYLNLCRGIEFRSVIVTHWQFADMVMTELQAFQHPVQVRTED